MQTDGEIDFEADESQYLLSDSDTEFNIVKPKKRKFRCLFASCRYIYSKQVHTTYVTNTENNLKCSSSQFLVIYGHCLCRVFSQDKMFSV